jgi:cytochrome c553
MRLRSRSALPVLGLLTVFGAALAGPPASGDSLAAGYRIYEQGRLPDGDPLRATRPEGFTFEGRSAACVSCHRRSGMGSVEGLLERTVLVPPVAGIVLFAPSRFDGAFLNPAHHYLPNDAWTRALTRPAYDEASLARALREGLDPGGKPLLAPMPRYDLDDAAIASVATYLRSLSAAPSPGVTEDTLHLASVVTPDAPPGQADLVLGVLRAWSASARGAGIPWRLHVWRLTGAPDSWDGQLSARYREQPVFAVLSGAGGAEWTPVHRFCEAQRLPCVLPSVELPPEDREGYYSVY